MHEQTKHTILIAARNVTQGTGTGRTIVEHARHLKAEGHRVVVVSETVDRSVLIEAGTKVHPTYKLPLGKAGKRRFFSRQVDWLAAWHKSSLVWGHGDNLNQTVLSLHNCVHLAAEVLNQKELSSVAALHAEQLRAQRFKLLICNSKLMQRDASSRFGVPEQRCQVIYPGYDPNQFNTSQRSANRRRLRAEWRCSDDLFVAALVTSGDFIKRNVSGCLQSFAQFRRSSNTPSKLVVVGKTSAREIINAMCRDLGLTDAVLLLEPRKDIEAVYHASDLCIHPALIEEFGQVVQEAVMSGTPVLTSRQVGATELFPQTDDVLVLNQPTEVELVKGLQTFAKNPDYCKAWWNAAHRSMSHNTWDHNFAVTTKAIWTCL